MSTGIDPTNPGGETRLIAPGLRIDVVPGCAVEPDRYHSILASDFAGMYQRGEDAWTHEEAMRETPRILIDALGGHVGGLTLLDVGCGRGVDVEMFAASGAVPHGVDLIGTAEWDRIRGRWPLARFHRGDLVELLDDGTLERGGFDAVMDNGCLHHQHPDRLVASLASIRAALRPSGLFALSVFEADDSGGRLMHNSAQRLFRDFTGAELVELGSSHGFTVDSVSRVDRGDDLAYLVGVFRPSFPAA